MGKSLKRNDTIFKDLPMNNLIENSTYEKN